MSDQAANRGRGWAYTGAALGGAVSIAANVAHSYVPPSGAPKDWGPHAGAVIMAVFWPVALFVAIEIWARVDWAAGRRWVALRFLGLLPVALVAAVVSYRHLSGLLDFYGEDGLTVVIGPLAVDGLMVMATGALIALGQASASLTHSDPAVSPSSSAAGSVATSGGAVAVSPPVPQGHPEATSVAPTVAVSEPDDFPTVPLAPAPTTPDSLVSDEADDSEESDAQSAPDDQPLPSPTRRPTQPTRRVVSAASSRAKSSGTAPRLVGVPTTRPFEVTNDLLKQATAFAEEFRRDNGRLPGRDQYIGQLVRSANHAGQLKAAVETALDQPDESGPTTADQSADDDAKEDAS